MNLQFVILLLLPSFAFADIPPRHPHSAYRPAHISFKVMMENYYRMNKKKLPAIEVDDTSFGSALPLEQLDTRVIPSWDKDINVLGAFKNLRDIRFLFVSSLPEFARRSSWMYPDDGCFARAALMIHNLKKWKLETIPSKLFIYGDLTVKTKNSPDGKVSWWYHVVPVIRSGQSVFVIDPAIDPNRPLLLHDWIFTMTDDPSKVKVSVCNSKTYIPFDLCVKPPASSDANAELDQLNYLEYEWKRVEELGKNPVRVLGDDPEWEK